MEKQLPSWHDGATKAAIADFVAQVSEEGGPDYVERSTIRPVPSRRWRLPAARIGPW
jgi:hypothetical protein